MDVNLIFKIAGIGILTAVLHILLDKAGRSEQALMVTLGGLIIVILIVLREISQLFDVIKSLFGF